MFDKSSQQCCQLPRARKSKLASGYTLIRITFPFQDTFHHFRTTWLIFCAVKFQVSMFDESSQLPRARKSKLASGYTLIKIHFTWTCILVLDLCSVHIRCAARASGLACVSVRCAAARHERRAAVALQSGGHRRPALLAVRPAVGRARRRQIGRPAAPRPAPRASRRPARRAARPAAAWRGAMSGAPPPRVPLPGRPAGPPPRPARGAPRYCLAGPPPRRPARRAARPAQAAWRGAMSGAPPPRTPLPGRPAAPPPRAARGAPRCCLALAFTLNCAGLAHFQAAPGRAHRIRCAGARCDVWRRLRGGSCVPRLLGACAAVPVVAGSSILYSFVDVI